MKAMRLPGEIYFLPADKLMDVQQNRPDLPKNCKLLLDLIDYEDDPAVRKAMR